MLATCAGRAPIATRIAISRVRCATVNDDDAVEADGGEQQRYGAEHAEQDHAEARRRNCRRRGSPRAAERREPADADRAPGSRGARADGVPAMFPRVRTSSVMPFSGSCAYGR